jgi:GT2 family glycosyltransferase
VRDQHDAPPFEVLVCSTGDQDAVSLTREVLPDARVAITGAQVLPGAGRNVLLDRARGELLLFLDDDVTVPPDLLRRLADLAGSHPEVAVFGGPNETPAGSSRFQVVQGEVLASPLGGGPVRTRYAARDAGPADERSFTLCNLAVRRRVMRPFSVELTCAEENDVLFQLRREGHRMWYDPGLRAFHERRATLRGFAAQTHKYGRGRGELTARDPRSLPPAFLAPAALVAFALAAVLLTMLKLVALTVPAPMAELVLAPLVAYTLVVGVASAAAAWSVRRLSALPLAALTLVVLHTCYGAGLWRGLLPSASRPEPRAVWFTRIGATYGEA